METECATVAHPREKGRCATVAHPDGLIDYRESGQDVETADLPVLLLLDLFGRFLMKLGRERFGRLQAA